MHALLLLGLLRTGRWQRTRCRTALSIEPAPAGFVEHDDLEPGERCVKALWATDDGVLLAAGALVSRGNEFDNLAWGLVGFFGRAESAAARRDPARTEAPHGVSRDRDPGNKIESRAAAAITT